VTDSQPSAYRATADDWLNAETMAAHDSGNGHYALRCILELRAKVEALETAQRKAAMDELRKASAELQSDHVPDTKKMVPTPEAAPVATDEELVKTWDTSGKSIFEKIRAIYDLGREHGATCPHIRSSDEGTSYCALAEQTAAAQPAEPAPTNPIVEQVRQGLYFATQRGARKAIREMATVGYSANPFNPVREHAENHGWLSAFAWLEQKANQ